MNPPNTYFGLALRDILDEHGLSQTAFALLVDCSQAHVSQLLNGVNHPSYKTLCKIKAEFSEEDFLLLFPDPQFLTPSKASLAFDVEDSEDTGTDPSSASASSVSDAEPAATPF